MITLELVEKIVNLVPISREDTFKLLKIEDNLTAEIYGNYEKFAIDQISEDAILYKIMKFAKGYKKLKEDEEIDTGSWVFVCKRGYVKFSKECLKYFWKYFKRRSDLNLLTRLKMSILKTKRWVTRIVYVCDAESFSECPELFNKKIKRLFDNKEIDRIYIYKTRDQFLLNQLYFDMYHKNKKGNT